MRTQKKIIATALMLCMLAVSFSTTVSALVINTGMSVGLSGTLSYGYVTSATNRTVATGLTYSKAVYTDAAGDTQAMYALEFNPKTSDYMPIMFSQYNGYGATVINSAKNAESRFGYDVLGAVNASFFSMTGSSCNTYGGVNISDGKIAQGNAAHGITQMLVFYSDGTGEIVSSKVAFDLSLNGSNMAGALQYVNIAPGTTYTGIYYYDASCGTSTDTSAAGVEIVFNKLDNTEITVGGTLRGEVAEIRANVSDGGAVGINQFVLYASDASSYATSLRALKIGDKAEITVSETVAASAEKMKRANSAFVTYGYNIVIDGKNVTESDGLGSDFNNASAQRTSVGFKPDGTVVIIATAGRKVTDNAPGLTVFELADMMISLGCTTAIDLDGGGSTQMIVENSSGNLIAELSSTRRVANSLLVVRRPNSTSPKLIALQSAMQQATALIADESLSDSYRLSLQVAYDNAQALIASGNAMNGDYTKAIMAINDANSARSILSAAMTGYDKVIFSQYSTEAIADIQTAYQNASGYYNSTSSTDSECLAAAELLATALAAKGEGPNAISIGKAYVTGTVNTSYPDTAGRELTDGNNIPASPTNAGWTGFHKTTKTGTDSIGDYIDIVLDLGAETSISSLSMNTLHYTPWGISAPSSVKAYYSTDGAAYTPYAYLTTTTNTLLNTMTSVKFTAKGTASARYILYRAYFASNHLFVSEVTACNNGYAAGIELTGFDKMIFENDAVLFTPSFGVIDKDTANLNWSHALFCQFNSAMGNYVITDIKYPAGSANYSYTAPENGFVIGLHGTSYSEYVINNAHIGDIVLLNNIDVSAKTKGNASFISFATPTTTAPVLYTDNHVHSYTRVVIPSDCQNRGYSVDRCTVCNEEFIVPNSYTEIGTHNYVPTYYSDHVDYVCPVCNESYTENVTPSNSSFYAYSDETKAHNYTGDRDADCFGVNIAVRGTEVFNGYKLTISWDPTLLSLYRDDELSYDGYYTDDIYDEGLSFISTRNFLCKTDNYLTGSLNVNDISARNLSATEGDLFVLDFHPATNQAVDAVVTVACTYFTKDSIGISIPVATTYTIPLNGGSTPPAPLEGLVDDAEIIVGAITESGTEILSGATDNKTVEYYASQFNGTVTVKDKNGNELANDAIVGTGCTVTNGENTYSVVVAGDINGDGLILVNDAIAILQKLADITVFDELQDVAGAVHSEETAVTVYDVIIVLQYCAELITALPCNA